MTKQKQTSTERGPGRPKDPNLVDRRKEAILDRATQLFAQRGYPNTDIDSLAHALQVGKGTIYRYFSSKQELFLAAVDRGIRHLIDEVNRCMADVSNPLDVLKQAIRSYLAFFDQHPDLIELFIQERAEFKDREQPTYFRYRDSSKGPWKELIDDLIMKGRLRAIRFETISDVVGDLLYGTIFTNHFIHRSASLEVQANAIIDIVFLGILSDQERHQLTEPCAPRSSL